MPTCQHCHQTWSYTETLKKLFRLAMICPYCSKQNYLSATTRRHSSMFSMLIIVVFFSLTWLSVPLTWSIIIILIGNLSMIAIYPYVAQLSKKEEPLW